MSEQPQELESMMPSELGMDTDQIDAVLDALTNREAEYNKDKTNGQILAFEVKALKEEFKDSGMDKSDFITEWADSHTEPYTTEVFKWYAASAERYYYADEAISEFGAGESIIKTLQMGIMKCLEEFAYAVLKDTEKEEE